MAGMGTRFLPVTKAGPKEMLPIIDKPVVQFAVEEALSIGIKKLVFVTSQDKRAIEDYFDTNTALEDHLQQKGKYQLLETVKDIVPGDVTVVYVRQSRPLGLGHAVLCARDVVGDEPFAVMLPDDVIRENDKGNSCLQLMKERYQQTGSSVLAVEEVPKHKTDQYGIVSLQADNQIKAIIEKPAPADAPSNCAVIGRYILTPAIFDCLMHTGRGAGGEIQLTDAIADLMKREAVYAQSINAKRYDCGSAIGLIQANIDYALQRDNLREPLLSYLEKLVQSQKIK